MRNMVDTTKPRVVILGAGPAGLGAAVREPFMAMSFMALPVIPELKLTDLGLVDVGAFQVVPLFGE